MRYRHRIIVEGLDGSGKTTLIKHLIKRYPDFFEVPGLGPHADFDKILPELFDAEDDNRVPVHDRLLFSELVYGPVLRGKININPELLNTAIWFLRNTAFLIYARPHSDQLREVVSRTPQMDGVAEYWPQLLESYDQLMMIEKQWFGNRFLQYVWHREEEYGLVEASLAGYLRS